MDKKVSRFPIGLKYGIYGVLLTMLFSPISFVLSFYLLAVKRNVNWDLTDMPIEFCCLAPIIALIFFSIPQLLGSYILGMLAEKTFLTRKWLHIVVGVVIGLVSGLIGICSIALLWGLTFAEWDWNMVIIVELWSIMIFIWIENRINRTFDVIK